MAERTALDDLARESQTVGAVAVGPLIGEPGVELTEDGGHAGIDLDAVETRVDGRLSGRPEALDQGGDVRLLHDHRHLAVDDVGHRRGTPERGLRVSRRALGAAMAEPGEDGGGEWATSVRHLPPPGSAVGWPTGRARTASRRNATDAVSVTTTPAPPSARAR